MAKSDEVLQAQLIKAQARIIQLESEVTSLQQAATAAKVKENSFTYVTKEDPIVERVHKLECERCKLVEEVAEVKAKLNETERQLSDATEREKKFNEKYDQDTQALKTQVENLMEQLHQLDCLNDEMQAELHEIHLLNSDKQFTQLEDLREHYSQSMETLRKRVAELETIESKFLSSEAEVKHLHHQLHVCRQDAHFVSNMRDMVVQYETLEQRVQWLTEENRSLRDDRANADLLRYQVQSLQAKSEELEKMEKEVARLQVENIELRAKENEGGEMSSPVLQLRIAELQQREVLALNKQGELATDLKVCQEELSQSHAALEELHRLLKLEKETRQSIEERVQKLERRLIFVTKERDGCVNVLNSYKLDSGVDGLMKELLAEKEQQLERSRQRIIELEEHCNQL